MKAWPSGIFNLWCPKCKVKTMHERHELLVKLIVCQDCGKIHSGKGPKKEGN